MKTHFILNSKNIGIKLIITCFFLSMIVMLASGCESTMPPSRGNLPYYPYSNPLFSLTKVGSLEQEYKNTLGAVIIKLMDNPQYYENEVYLVPGSAEEKLFLKSGVKTSDTNKYYTFEAKIVQVIDDRNLNLCPNDIITLKNVYSFSFNDPLYQYQQVSPSQEYMICLMQQNKDKGKNIFWYSDRVAYFIKDDAVFATNKAASIDMYSGKSIVEFTNILKAIPLSANS
jgi:hypothetical protein